MKVRVKRNDTTVNRFRITNRPERSNDCASAIHLFCCDIAFAILNYSVHLLPSPTSVGGRLSGDCHPKNLSQQVELPQNPITLLSDYNQIAFQYG